MSASRSRVISLARRAGVLLVCSALCLPATGNADTVDVTLKGLTGEALTNVQASLSIRQRGKGDSLDADTIEALHNRASNEIRLALEPFGYYRPEIIAKLAASASGANSWQATYDVQAGPRVTIGKLDLSFSELDKSQQQRIRNSLTLTPGAPLDHRQYESDKQNLLDQVKNLGYLDARYATSRVEVDLDAYVASITLAIDAQRLYVIGPITLEQDRFAPEYLAKYLLLEEGVPFNHALISEQRVALSKSGYFQEVNIQQGVPSQGDSPAIPIHILLKPYKPNRYRGRLGWGTDTDFGVQADWTRRYLGKRGHQFTLGGTAVQDRDRLAADASYVIPLNPISGNRLELAARHESKDFNFEDVELDEGGETRIATNLLSLFWHLPEKQLGEFEWIQTAGLSMVSEDYDVFEVLFGNLPGSAQDAIIDAIGPRAYNTLTPDFEAMVPGLRFVLRRTDDPLYIRRGEFYKLELLGADDAVGSNITFWQARFNSWNILPVGDSGRLLMRSALGYTDAKSRNVLNVNFNQLPEYYEFRTGGARSVRGYSFEELFPSDAITGGKHLVVGSVEYEHEIISDWSVAAFLDGGNAFNDFDNIDEKLGAGIGVRWRSPVGVARIDLAFPLDDADDSFQIYITVGPEF